MKLILNIVWKDFLRLRWMVLGAWAVTVGKFGLGWWLMLGATPELEAWKELPKFAGAFAGAEALFAWLITGSLVLEDSLRGTQAAWRTRPIAGVRLLAAKGLGAFLMLGAPVVVCGVPWWVFNGFGFADVATAALVGVGMQVLVIVPSMFVATLVDSIARFVVWSVVVVAATATFPLVWAVVLSRRLPTGSEAWGFVVVAVVLVAMAAVVVGQFRCGVRRRVLLSGTAAVVVLLAVGGNGLVRDLRGGLDRPWVEHNAAAARDVKLTWRSSMVYDVKKNNESYAHVHTRWAVEGLAGPLVVDLVSAQHEWTWKDGPRVSQPGWPWSGIGVRAETFGLKKREPEADAETLEWLAERRRAFAAKHGEKAARSLAVRPEPEEIVATSTVPVQLSVAARLRTVESSYVTQLNLRVVKVQTWFELPLTAEAQRAAHGYRLRVSGVTQAEAKAVVRLVESHPAAADFSLSEYTGWLRSMREPSYVGIDRESGRLELLRGETSASLMIGGVTLQARVVGIDAPKVIRGGKWTVVDREWLGRLRLNLVGWEEMARIKREVRRENFLAAK